MKTAYFPSPRSIPSAVEMIVELFREHEYEITSEVHDLRADDVLRTMSGPLLQRGVVCAITPDGSSKRPIVLAADDPNRSLVAKFDTYHRASKTALNVLAGQGIINNTYLRSLLHASLAAEVRHMVIAVRITYKGSRNFDTANEFFEPLMNSAGTHLDLDSLTLIGY